MRIRTFLTVAVAAGTLAMMLSYPAITPTARDDYVTTSPDIAVRNAFVADVEINGTQASDHRPVVADLQLRRRE